MPAHAVVIAVREATAVAEFVKAPGPAQLNDVALVALPVSVRFAPEHNGLADVITAEDIVGVAECTTTEAVVNVAVPHALVADSVYMPAAAVDAV